MQQTRFTLPLWGYGLLPALCCLVRGLSDRLYTDIDSFLISMNCAGLYGPDSACPTVHPLLSTLVGGLSRLCPGPDWFSLLSHCFLTLGVWWVGTLVALCCKDTVRRWALLLFLSFILLQQSLFNTNFTLLSGLFSFCGAVTLLVSLRRPMPRPVHGMAAAFLCLSVLWRASATALLVPYLLLAIGTLAISRRVSLRTLRQVLLPSLIPLILLVAITAGFHGLSPVQREATTYNLSRSQLIDYPHKSWEEVRSTLAPQGWSENDYQALVSGVLLDTDLVTADLLKEVAAVARTTAYPVSLQGLASILRVIPALFSTPLLRGMILLALVLLAALWCVPLPWTDRLSALLAWGGSLLICLYYQFIGRLPERVAACVLLALLAVELSLYLCAPVRSAVFWRWCRRLLCAAAGCALCLCLWQNRYSYHIVQTALLAGQNRTDETTLSLDASEDAVYLWDSMTLALYMTDHYMAQGQLPGEAFVRHNLSWGEWNTSGQPVLAGLLADLEMDNPMQSLLTRPHTYLVTSDPTLVESWLQEHYDPTATVVQTGTVEVFALGEVPVWQVVAG